VIADSLQNSTHNRHLEQRAALKSSCTALPPFPALFNAPVGQIPAQRGQRVQALVMEKRGSQAA